MILEPPLLKGQKRSSKKQRAGSQKTCPNVKKQISRILDPKKEVSQKTVKSPKKAPPKKLKKSPLKSPKKEQKTAKAPKKPPNLREYATVLRANAVKTKKREAPEPPSRLSLKKATAKKGSLHMTLSKKARPLEKRVTTLALNS